MSARDDLRINQCSDTLRRAEQYAFVIRDLQCDHLALGKDVIINRMLIDKLRSKRDALFAQAIRGMAAMSHPAHEADFIAALKHSHLGRDK